MEQTTHQSNRDRVYSGTKSKTGYPDDARIRLRKLRWDWCESATDRSQCDSRFEFSKCLQAAVEARRWAMCVAAYILDMGSQS